MSRSIDADLVVVGGGIVGLATSLQLLAAHPGLRIAISRTLAASATERFGLG